MATAIAVPNLGLAHNMEPLGTPNLDFRHTRFSIDCNLPFEILFCSGGEFLSGCSIVFSDTG